MRIAIASVLAGEHNAQIRGNQGKIVSISVFVARRSQLWTRGAILYFRRISH
jgi:hypothetical protein